MASFDWAELLDSAPEDPSGDLYDLAGFVRTLRHVSDRYPVTHLEMSQTQARLLAADLEELFLLRAVPPTGDAG